MKTIGWDKFSLHTNTLESIIGNKLLKNLYNNSWKNPVDKGKKIFCAQICGDVNAIDTIFQDEIQDIPGRTNLKVRSTIDTKPMI